jgi:hypothetical protein
MTTDELLALLRALAGDWARQIAVAEDYDFGQGIEHGLETASDELGVLLDLFEKERQ